MSYESYLIDVPSNSWLIDTGASIHITNSFEGYLTRKRLSKGELTITLGNGTGVEIEAIDTLRLILDSGFIMYLVDTTYVPVFTRNLISIPKLDSYGYGLKFGNNGVSLFYNSYLVSASTLLGNLYSLNLDYKYSQSLLSYHVHESSRKQNRVNENSSILWHKILCHISRKMMERLVKDVILVSLDFLTLTFVLNASRENTFRLRKIVSQGLLNCWNVSILTFGVPIILQLSMDISTSLLLLMTFQGILMCILFMKSLKHYMLSKSKNLRLKINLTKELKV